jgi:predicted RNase H-like HicB family nuclease
MHIAWRVKVLPVKPFGTIDEYVTAAVAAAVIEKIDGGRTIYADIPGFRGIWAQGSNLQQARKELRQALAGWIELQLERGYELPPIDGKLKDPTDF